MDEQYVSSTVPSAQVIMSQQRENQVLAEQYEAVRLVNLTPRGCIHEAADAASGLYDLFFNTDVSKRDLMELLGRPNMARGIGALLVFVAGSLLLMNGMLSGVPS